MFRIWFSVGLSATVALITLSAGVFAEARLITIFYRTLISLVVFGIIGYFLSGIIQKKFMDFMISLHSNSKNIDIHVDRQSEHSATDGLQQMKNQEFQPFTVGDLERVYSNDK